MKVVLFLTEPDDTVQGIPAYGIIDCYLGKFFYDNDGNIHPSTEFTSENTAKLSDFDEPMTESAILSNINAVAEKGKINVETE